VDGEVDFVLDRGVKALGQRRIFVVINAGGVDVGDFLIKAPLTGADVLDAAGQFLEVIVAFLRIFQAIVIEHEALGDVFLELVRRPLAESHGHGATHAEAES
jgi:hypothetical protein